MMISQHRHEDSSKLITGQSSNTQHQIANQEPIHNNLNFYGAVKNETTGGSNDGDTAVIMVNPDKFTDMGQKPH